ncbi:TRAP transporter substrate-binding protein (plasmid) [Phaeobacter inhibens]|uniref:TRAP transporter substrate-binding protein n=1 Tax=Phaeobacter inhibens TaxID=221822 RepID=UPI0021A538D7|nr:TRAP transporter substrate-binding protein [Phaeobacter inhibens]UWS05985.1 TRAP transporter substrate-binding protein [Phaeobacter inhibens]
MNTLMKTVTVAAVASVALGGAAWAADLNLKFQGSDPAGSPNFELQKSWADSIEQKTGGKVAIELLPVTSIVAHNETQDAIAAGILDGHVTDTSYFAGKDPAFGLIANPVGAWSAPQEMFDFINTGGGSNLMNELLNPYGLQFIGAMTPGLEAFVSKVPVNGVDDLKGLKMRAPEGMVQNVFSAAGAAPVNLPASEVFTSLDKGVIEAADYSVFSTNASQGMHDVAPYPIYPGFHSMPLVEVSINKNTWDSLDDETQNVLIGSVKEYALIQVNSLAERDQKAVEEAKAGGKVTVIDWTPEERAKFRTIAATQWISVAERSSNAQHVYDVLTGYLKDNGLIK